MPRSMSMTSSLGRNTRVQASSTVRFSRGMEKYELTSIASCFNDVLLISRSTRSGVSGSASCNRKEEIVYEPHAARQIPLTSLRAKGDPMERTRRSRLLQHLACIVTLLITLGNTIWTPTALAASITVTTTTDELNTDGDCSLREAVRAANLDRAVDACTAGSGADTITLAAGTYGLTRSGGGEQAAATGDLDISGTLTIHGAGQNQTFVDGNDAQRVFEVLPGSTATFTALTIRNGYAERDPSASEDVSSQLDGGGIFNSDGVLTIIDSSLTGNAAFRGGGFYNGTGTATLTNSTLNGNAASWDGDGAGGFLNDGGTVSVVGSTLHNNRTPGSGGGFYNWGGITMSHTTISENYAGSGGGGFANNFGATATLTNTTITGNEGSGAAAFFNTSTVILNNATIAHNRSLSDGASGAIDAGSAPTVLQNTILAGNTTVNGTAADCSGSITSQGYNLIGSTRGCTISGDITGNILNVDPQLGPLQDNGGPTRTHALLPGSPAIDAGNPAGPGSSGASCAATDQRGVARPQDGDGDTLARCDIGAYEVEARKQVTPQERIGALKTEVQHLVAQRVLNRGQGQALSSKLNAALHKLNQGKATPAVNQLHAFVKQAEAYKHNKILSMGQAQALINAANTIIGQLRP